jgi:hypothetical protein
MGSLEVSPRYVSQSSMPDWNGIVRNAIASARALRSELRTRVFENTSGCIFCLMLPGTAVSGSQGLNPAEGRQSVYQMGDIRQIRRGCSPPELTCQVISNYRRCVEGGDHLLRRRAISPGRRYFHTVLIRRNNVGDIYRIVGAAAA